ncbi:class I SAM-dependent DNA methyltransferase [Plantactinospora veratri]|uniref:site-specific DNA-methyltransferase (adenine-specific) n=1 Tax=Plantactinospora veratri TaxID=1436122 RepID=A0ABU7SAE0_9ACTN
MSFESLTNRGEYLSAHYLAEVLPTTLKGGLVKRWSEEERGGRLTPRAGLRGFRRDYFDRKIELADPELFDPERLRKLHFELLKVLGFGDPQAGTITVERAGQEQEIPVAHAELGTGPGIVAVECGWAVDTDAAQDPTEAGRLLSPVELAGGERLETGAKLASWLFAAEQPPRYVLIMSGGVITLADRSVWGEGRYLAVSLDVAYGRNDERELDVVAALFGADSLRPPAEGGSEPLADLVAGSRQHAVGVSGELREGLRTSVELIANEVLDRIREAGYRPEQVADLDELARDLRREALRYLYRILFLLYAEARPELGVLPVNDPEYVSGYSLARLGDLISRRLPPSAEEGFHLYESLDLLCRMVNEGHRPRGAGEEVGEQTSEDVGLRFEPMRSDLFLPEAIRLIGRQIPQPGGDEDDDSDDFDGPDAPKLDTRLRNRTLYQVLRRLMITKGGKRKRGGFISYAQLGINQLGAVYEGLMSYTGFVATERLYEVAKHGDPKDGSWMIPESKVDDYDDEVFVLKENPVTGAKSRIPYEPGSFVYRLAGRDRQTSASYYTPQSLTEVTVQLALKYRIEEAGDGLRARDLLDWTICEPALGSGAFLNEAINQVAAEYLRRRQEELETALEPEDYHLELQRVKAYIALHNCYGVDLNRTAVELAEVSLWLNVMHVGLQAPWFGLHLKRGNSLIGGGRRLYRPEQLADKSWLNTAPEDRPFRDGAIEPGTIHHFLLPADGWGAVAGEKEARELAPAETEKLKKWRTAMKRVPSAKGTKKQPSQVARLQGLARRVEYLWKLVQDRLAISEREIRRDIKVWGADDLPEVTEAVAREKILADLTAHGTPYWRLKTLMDVWCALWFWPLDKVGLLDGSDSAAYPATPVEVTHVREEPAYDEPAVYEVADIFGQVESQQLKMPVRSIGTRRVTVAEQLRQQVALASLDDWLTFAEALVGRRDMDEDTERFWGRKFDSLTEMDDFEGSLDGLVGVDSPWTLAERFPWLLAAERIADQQGFFHWELTFAQAFGKGGFDLQVGNPPWVRPRWLESLVLAERDPWFALVDKVVPSFWQTRRSALALANDPFYLNELIATFGTVAFLTSPVAYQLLAGTQPDYYRAFMCRVWSNLSPSGIGALIHPDSHFGGVKEGRLRSVAYHHLRLHAHFQNMRLLFPEVDWNKQFGIHLYGRDRGTVSFKHLSWLYATETLAESLEHSGDGDLPGMKYEGSWDLRPHLGRVLTVTVETLAIWKSFLGSDAPLEMTQLIYPVTVAEQKAIFALGKVERRVVDAAPMISSGLHEKGAKDVGLIRWDTSDPGDWGEVVLQGPHLNVANPLSKHPNIPCKSNKDYEAFYLPAMSSTAVPRTNYRRATDIATYDGAKSLWRSASYTSYFRIAWREMVPLSTERSLFAALIPPGPTHVHGVRSMAFGSNRETALNAGFWASLPLDYLLRISGRGHLDVSEANAMPIPDPDHPLAAALLLRVLRLNCLTSAYAPLWSELFSPVWQQERWAMEWESLPEAQDLGNVAPIWERGTPLRTERARRAALVEIDALVAVFLGIQLDELLSMYRARFSVLAGYESAMWFDSTGRRITRDYYARGVGQRQGSYEHLMAHLEDPDRNPVPDGYELPFYRADREREYEQAHTKFARRLAAQT